MPMTTLLGLSFGVFPCLLFGFIMLLSLLMCEYIEEYVAKHLCAWKNRRRRGLRSFYRDFRDRRSTPNSNNAQPYPSSSSRTRTYSNPGIVGGQGAAWPGSYPTRDLPDNPRFSSEGSIVPYLPSAPSSTPAEGLERQVNFGAQFLHHYSPVNDPPPSYEECVLSRMRSSGNSTQHHHDNNASTTTSSKNRSKSKHWKKSSSNDKDFK